MTEYERGFIDGIKSKVSAELTPTLINVSKTMLEMLKPVLSTALENALNDNNAITETDVQPVKRGHWKDIMMSEATGWDLSLTGGRDAVCETVCSVCGNCCAFGGDGDLYLSPYCPNCGAKMDLKDGEQNENNQTRTSERRS